MPHVGIILHGYEVVLAQNRTWSHTVSQNLRLHVSTRIHFDIALMFLLSCRQLVVIIPEAKFTSSHATVSTITAFCATTVSSQK